MHCMQPEIGKQRSPKPTTMFTDSPFGSSLGCAVFRSPLILSVNCSWYFVASVAVSNLYVPLTDSVTAKSSDPSALEGNTFTVALSVKPADKSSTLYEGELCFDIFHKRNDMGNKVRMACLDQALSAQQQLWAGFPKLDEQCQTHCTSACCPFSGTLCTHCSAQT